jgi:D-alanyl-D-alanine carboxypeptidase (penicillin-binding protein 5/6)
MLPQALQRFRMTFVAATVAAVVFSGLPVSARAAVLDADTVGTVSVGDQPSLRAVAPDLYISSGVLETIDGRVLWSRDPDSQHAMASTTKIMTAVVALEHSSLSDTVTVDAKAAAVGQSSMGLIVGEKFTLGELMKGVLVQSGNDAATLVAEFVGGTESNFVRMMNDKAAALDLINTHYMNPHGLDAKGHYTSANDLVSLARYAMRIPTFRDIVGTYTVKVRSNRYTHLLTSHNTMLKSYKGAEGVKTGNTNNAGYSIVFAAKRNGVELVGAVLDAATDAGRTQQTKALFDWGFAHYKVTTLVQAGERLGRVPVSDYMERTVAATTSDVTTAAVFDVAGPVQRRIELLKDVPAPVIAGETIGTLTVYQGTTVLKQVPLVAATDVPTPTAWQRVVFFFGKLWRGIFGS